MNVFTYWEGSMPPYIQDCLESVRRVCRRDCRHVHVTPKNFESLGLNQVLHPNWHRIRELGVKSDCVRAACLALYGGMYIDADTVMLRSPAALKPSASCLFMTWPTPPRRVIAGYIYADREIGQQWLDNVNSFLSVGKTGWTDLGERCLTPVVDANPSKCVEMPLSTFLPINIDQSVEMFFTTRNVKDVITKDTIAVGLNHSWMMSRKRQLMMAPSNRMRNSPLLIHKVLTECRAQNEEPPRIAVCCVTYKRPHLLAKLMRSFEEQDYGNSELVILDDSGDLRVKEGDNVRFHSTNVRYGSLGEKRNAASRMVSDDAVAIAPWDDDDLAAPWALRVLAIGLRQGDWLRPSMVLVPGPDGKLHQVETYAIPDQSDKAFHPAWAYTVGAFQSVGGYPEGVSLGEDLVLATKLRDAHITEYDPISPSCPPYYLFGPWSDEHFSYTHKDYATWNPQYVDSGEVVPVDHGVDFNNIGRARLRRPFRNNWWGDEIR